MTDIITLKNELLEISELIVATALKHSEPVSDELSTREAGREFGTRWIADRTKRELLTCRRKGHFKNSPKVYSRAECLALKEAERRGAVIVRKGLEG